VQDDAEKVVAIAMMDFIYGKAILTICAATGSDADTPLPGIRGNERTPDQHVEDCNGTRLMVVHLAERHIQSTTWNSRAWTFQERLLSKCL
jgi:hypothetical protein